MKDVITGQIIFHYSIAEKLDEPACRQAGVECGLYIKTQVTKPDPIVTLKFPSPSFTSDKGAKILHNK